MTYFRVIPRDLFNESSLLKCLGQLVIKMEAHEHTAYLREPERAGAFDIQQDEGSGAIAVVNLPFTIGGRPYRLTRPLNSRNPWPLYAEDDDDDAVSVFTDEGELTEDFLDLISAR